jgi:hypothetical protein
VKAGRLKALVTPGGHSRIFSAELDDEFNKNVNVQSKQKVKKTGSSPS